MAKLLSLIIGVAVTTIAAAGSASAADMALKAPPPVVAPVAFVWTGCYVGGNVGGGLQSTRIADPAQIDLPYPESTTGAGLAGGGQVGCDYQVDSNLVVGVRGMFDDMRLNQSLSYNSDFLDPTDPCCFGALNVKTNWFATALGRIGYLVVPNGLVYLKGGAAWKKVSYSDNFFGECTACTYTGSATILGWDFGAGLEYAFVPNLSAFVELDYMGFPSSTTTLTNAAGGTESFQYSHSLLVILAGLNLRFHP